MKKEQDKKGTRTLGEVIGQFEGKRICVVGDIIADIYIFGKPYRLSREAPVVIVKFEESKIYPGSAGNTINNLLALGAHVYPLGFIGNDNTGKKLMQYFSQHKNIDIGGLIMHDGETVTKTRILAGDTHTSKQQVIRIDKDSNRPLSRPEKTMLMKKLKAIAPLADAFIVSDYGHGTISKEVIGFMRDLAKRKIVVGDSRYGLAAFNGFTIVTPNESEAYRLSGLGEDHNINVVGKTIMGTMKLKALLITRGNKGMRLFVGDRKIYDIPISGTDDVTDVTGAGDTVCSTIALSLAGGADFYTASRIANYAAGVVVMKRGTATVTVQELEKAIGNQGELQ